VPVVVLVLMLPPLLLRRVEYIPRLPLAVPVVRYIPLPFERGV
jgi:hypothetical protein